jgi:hypothetical protein
MTVARIRAGGAIVLAGLDHAAHCSLCSSADAGLTVAIAPIASNPVIAPRNKSLWFIAVTPVQLLSDASFASLAQE